jgi:hypothetical protein
LKLSQHILPTALMARRFHLSTELVIGLFALYGALVFNQSLLSLTLQLHPWHEPASWGLLAGILAIVTSLHFLLLALVSTQKNVKFWVLLFAIAGTLAAHYQAHYRVYFDPSMMRNIIHTDYAEARELISWSLFSSVAVWFIPLALVLRQVQVKSVSRTRALQQRLLAVLLAGGVLIVVMLSLYAPLSSMMRNHKEARYLITPANTLWGLLQVVDNDTQAWAQGARLPIGLDAHAVPRPAARTRPLLVVWVVGETARAANWGLNGYSRATTPELAHWAAQPGFIHFPWRKVVAPIPRYRYPACFLPGGGTIMTSAAFAAASHCCTYWHEPELGCIGAIISQAAKGYAMAYPTKILRSRPARTYRAMKGNAGTRYCWKAWRKNWHSWRRARRPLRTYGYCMNWATMAQLITNDIRQPMANFSPLVSRKISVAALMSKPLMPMTMPCFIPTPC